MLCPSSLENICRKPQRHLNINKTNRNIPKPKTAYLKCFYWLWEADTGHVHVLSLRVIELERAQHPALFACKKALLHIKFRRDFARELEIGRASCRERVCQYV